MSSKSALKVKSKAAVKRPPFTAEFKAEAVQMLVDGHSAASIVERLGISCTQTLYRWRKELVTQQGPPAVALEARVRALEAQLRRVERERDILKKALSIFGRDES